jgi:hypothetical protein
LRRGIHPQSKSILHTLLRPLGAARRTLRANTVKMAVLSARSQAAGLQTSRRSFAAARVARPVRNVVVRAEEGTATAAKPAWTVPTLNPDTPSPIFGGSTGGLLRKAQVAIPTRLSWQAAAAGRPRRIAAAGRLAEAPRRARGAEPAAPDRRSRSSM